MTAPVAMAPRERAADVVIAVGDRPTRFQLMDAIEAAITAAVREERERCAGIVGRLHHLELMQRDRGKSDRMRNKIEAAIRATPSPKET